jgi:hypothetical protein
MVGSTDSVRPVRRRANPSLFEPRERRDTEEIEFDFFDDAPTREASEREQEPRRRRLPRRPPTAPPPQQLRLAALVVGLIALVVVLVVFISSCQDDKRGTYEAYMNDVGEVTGSSDRVGRDLRASIARPGINLSDLEQELDGLRGQQAQLVERAQALDAPGPLREEQDSLVEALQLRASGLAGLAQGFAQASQSGGARATGRALAEQAKRFVASDVVYDDLFRVRSQEAMRQEGVSGVDVPTSIFLTSPELGQAGTWTALVRRLTESPEAGGLHGNQINGVVVLPGGKRLSPTEENTVEASEETGFQVLVRNSGDSLETGVEVTLRIVQSPTSITKKQTVDLIQPGQTKAVVFGDLGEVTIAEPATLRVNVAPVSQEENLGNNSAEYQVIFSFG